MSIYQDGKLYLYGAVGEFPGEEYFTAREVLDALREHGPDRSLVVQINSGGGYTSDGTAIYNALAAHRGAVEVQIDGIAASAASLIAMAGDELLMRHGSYLMIHEPNAITAGSAADHAKSGEMLNVIAEQAAGIYAKRSRKTKAACRALMQAETWLTAADAVREGFADCEMTLPAKAVARFDYKQYRHPPQAVARSASGWGDVVAASNRRRVSLVDTMRKQCGIPDPATGKSYADPKPEGLLITSMLKGLDREAESRKPSSWSDVVDRRNEITRRY